MADLRIGCSGFLYDHWKGNFYPEDLPKRRWLEHYSRNFTTVELNVTFYRLPDRETFAKWYLGTPADFVFAVKGSRFITHVKKMKDCAEPIEAFFSRASVLKEKLAVVLWQLPPNFNADIERLEEFLHTLRPFGFRNTFEFRNKSWMDKKVASLMKKEKTSLCMADQPEFLARLPVTTDFVYMRRHGATGGETSSYNTDMLTRDANTIKGHLAKKKDVFIYFNNDAEGYAPKNAAELTSLTR